MQSPYCQLNSVTQLWHCKVRSRHFRHVRPPPRPHDEVCYPRHYGWYHCSTSSRADVLHAPDAVPDLRSRRVGPDLRRAYVGFPLAHVSACSPVSSVKMRMTLFQGFVQLGAGLSVGLAGLAAGFAIGIVGDAGVRGTAQQPRLFVGMVRAGLISYPGTSIFSIHFADSYSHLRRGFGSLWYALLPSRCLLPRTHNCVGLIVALIMNSSAADASSAVSIKLFLSLSRLTSLSVPMMKICVRHHMRRNHCGGTH